MRRTLSFEGKRHRVEACPESGHDFLAVQVEGSDGLVVARSAPGGWTITHGRRTVEAGITRQRCGDLVVQIEGHTFRITDGRGTGGPSDRGQSRIRRNTGSRSEVRTSMPGKVVRLLFEEGDRVTEGDGVLIFEAMKMQNEIRAPESGVIANMRAVAGTPMESGEVLFAVEPANSP